MVRVGQGRQGGRSTGPILSPSGLTQPPVWGHPTPFPPPAHKKDASREGRQRIGFAVSLAVAGLPEARVPVLGQRSHQTTRCSRNRSVDSPSIYRSLYSQICGNYLEQSGWKARLENENRTLHPCHYSLRSPGVKQKQSSVGACGDLLPSSRARLPGKPADISCWEAGVALCSYTYI